MLSIIFFNQGCLHYLNGAYKWITLGDIILKGKKNDHVYLIKHYDAKLINKGNDKVKYDIMHTNNFPTKYKCSQNVYHVTRGRNSIESCIIQKFAQKYAVKGSLDGVGKVVKEQILKSKLKYDQRANSNNCTKIKPELYERLATFLDEQMSQANRQCKLVILNQIIVTRSTTLSSEIF